MLNGSMRSLKGKTLCFSIINQFVNVNQWYVLLLDMIIHVLLAFLGKGICHPVDM